MSKLTLKNFEKNLLIYGSNFHLWDSYSSEELRAFIAENDAAISMYVDAQELDMQLDDFAVPDANPEIAIAALAQIKRSEVLPQQKETKKAVWPVWDAVFAMRSSVALACAVFLILGGVFVQQNYLPQGEETQALLVAEANALLDELNALAEAEQQHDSLMMAFNEVEQEVEVEKFLDELLLDDVMPTSDNLWEYFEQEG